MRFILFKLCFLNEGEKTKYNLEITNYYRILKNIGYYYLLNYSYVAIDPYAHFIIE